jgi:hypothetical protein
MFLCVRVCVSLLFYLTYVRSANSNVGSSSSSSSSSVNNDVKKRRTKMAYGVVKKYRNQSDLRSSSEWVKWVVCVVTLVNFLLTYVYFK